MRYWLKKTAFVGCAFGILVAIGSAYWHLSPENFLAQGGKVIASHALSWLYVQDIIETDTLRERFFCGKVEVRKSVCRNAWKYFQQHVPGFVYDAKRSKNFSIPVSIPFVYEDINAPYLLRLRNRYHLDAVVSGASNEFEAMLLLAKWVGTRWDHGTDSLPREGKYDPLAILEKVHMGAKYWCEISAILMVQAATSMGWPARLVTASRDGYHWEHALAELWSNQFGKWFVIDADYNIFYMANGKPLSAYELCHFGPTLQQNGKLHVKQFAPMKPSLKLQDLLPYYRYVHIDLRNDWYSRELRRGSPVGGDLATWWTARPGLEHLLTAKKRVDDQSVFDWLLNVVYLYPERKFYDEDKGTYVVEVSLIGYSPYFVEFQVSLDDSGFQSIQGDTFTIDLSSGYHCLKARLLTQSGETGPVSSVCFEYDPPI